jgi:hypothetical protein
MVHPSTVGDRLGRSWESCWVSPLAVIDGTDAGAKPLSVSKQGVPHWSETSSATPGKHTGNISAQTSTRGRHWVLLLGELGPELGSTRISGGELGDAAHHSGEPLGTWNFPWASGLELGQPGCGQE